jgi:uncharacterized membrane protein
MKAKAAITVMRSREELERLWRSSDNRPEYIDRMGGAVTFADAPGDRGAEVHVDLGQSAPGGKLGEVLQAVLGTAPLTRVKDDLRRFKQQVETGEIPRSDAVPEGERFERKLKQRPAQPLPDGRREQAGV